MVLTVSHILIAHRGSRSEGTGLRAPEWNPDLPVSRTREEAQRRAVSIARDARARPGAFAALAREHSDDPVTKEQGGSLGTISAYHLPAEFLDALGTLKPGQVSRVVETALGFHVIAQRDTPPGSSVSARRVLIGYATTTATFDRQGRPKRTRDEALAIARQVAARAVREPARFIQLVEEHTDHADALRDGYFGTWSTHQAFLWSREVELIAALPVGGVSEPIDSFHGFNVFMRIELQPRVELAARYLDVELEEDPRTSQPKLAPDLRRLAERPDAFEALQGKYCCRGDRRWELGRGDPRIEHALLKLATAQVTTEPMRIGERRWRWIKRIAPDPPKPEQVALSALPSAASADTDALVEQVSARDLSAFLFALKKEKGSGFGVALREGEAGRFEQIVDRFEQRAVAASPGERLVAVRAAREELRALLGDARYLALRANIQSELKQVLASGR